MKVVFRCVEQILICLKCFWIELNFRMELILGFVVFFTLSMIFMFKFIIKFIFTHLFVVNSNSSSPINLDIEDKYQRQPIIKHSPSHQLACECMLIDPQEV